MVLLKKLLTLNDTTATQHDLITGCDFRTALIALDQVNKLVRMHHDVPHGPRRVMLGR